MRKFIKKLKRLVGISVSEYTIIYTNPLTMEQKSELINHMITKFVGTCRPNRLTVGQKIVVLDFTNPCLTGDALKIISDNTLSKLPADINSILLDGKEICFK